MDEHLLRVGGEVGELVDGLPLPGQLGRISLGPHGARLAEMGLAGEAVVAMAAEDGETSDDVIARLELAHLEAYLFHDPGGLVAQDGGGGEGIEAVDEVQVAVADAGGDGAHEHLATHGLVDVDFLDRQGLMRAMEHGSFHGGLLLDFTGPGASHREQAQRVRRRARRVKP